MNSHTLNKFSPYFLALLRIIVGYMFLSHGVDKLFINPVELSSLFGIGGVIELLGGVLFLLGLFTRPVAFILSGQMAFAYFVIHGGNPLLPLVNHGELAALYSLVFLYFVFSGAGALALDNRFSK